MRRCETLEKEREDQKKTIQRMERKLKGKVDRSFIQECLTDPDAARNKLNKQMGGIRVGSKTK